MAEPPDSAATSHYALRPTTPVRALVLAGCCLLFGALGAFFGVQNANSVLVALGVALAVAGVALTITAVVFVSSRTTHITLSPEGFEVSGHGYQKSGAWLDVDKVASTPDGTRLVISQGHVDRTYIQAPGCRLDDRMRAITADIAARLEAPETTPALGDTR